MIYKSRSLGPVMAVSDLSIMSAYMAKLGAVEGRDSMPRASGDMTRAGYAAWSTMTTGSTGSNVSGSTGNAALTGPVRSLSRTTGSTVTSSLS